MTKDKALKRDVRARMAKTGESYAAARHILLDGHLPEPEQFSEPDRTPEPAPPSAPDVDLGMSDEAMIRSTGHPWGVYFVRLDEWGAAERTHAEIAKFVASEWGLNGWWSQNVTVGYERARGRRKVNELTSGFAANASKTFSVPVETLYNAVADDAIRASWLEPELIAFRSLNPNKAWRCEIVADKTRVEFYFTVKSPVKTVLQVQHTRLASESDVATWRAFWKDRLNRLSAELTS